MHKTSFRYRTLVGAAIVAAAVSQAAHAQSAARLMVNLANGEGQPVGSATIVPKGKGVQIFYNLKGLTPGQHAFHIHQNAKCEGPAFTTAGGHFNPDMKKHGLENPEGPHAGDMKNFIVKADGTAQGNLEDPRVSLSAEGANGLLANGGTALVIHAGPDDMKTDPAGNAGDRIACGVIAAPSK